MAREPLTDSPWPLTSARDDAGRLRIGGVDVADLAASHGTPLWVVDEEDLRTRCRAYVDAFPDVWVAYASKAWCAVGILQIVAEEGLWVDVVSGGELHTAKVAGVPMDRVVFHGSNKSLAELRMAAQLGVGRVVADSFEELERLENVGDELDHTFATWLRITPGIDAHTHEYTRTGHDDSKFGFTLSLGLADTAMRRTAELRHVDVVGIHAHIGSQIFGTDPFVANAEVLIALLARWRDELGVTLAECNLGGGMGVRYTSADDPVPIGRYGEAVLAAVDRACEEHGYPRPQLAVEPGRAIIAPAVVTLYEIGTVKRLEGMTTYVSVDGGMSDNIRPALYQAEHDVALVNRSVAGELEVCTVVGKHCESGDLVRDRVPLPADLAPGDLLAVAATGAYTASMASNYNRLPRPAAVLVRAGEVRTLQRRETYEDVVARDAIL
ncbi:MAG: diaminopimelate decarboxylase [Actinobacteria bacterium]|nr:diaminopimelate decarboxylase [Actinomycetota bacterium]